MTQGQRSHLPIQNFNCKKLLLNTHYSFFTHILRLFRAVQLKVRMRFTRSRKKIVKCLFFFWSKIIIFLLLLLFFTSEPSFFLDWLLRNHSTTLDFPIWCIHVYAVFARWLSWLLALINLSIWCYKFSWQLHWDIMSRW